MTENDDENKQVTSSRRARRRAVRPSDAEGIDRSADLPDDRFGVPTTWDSEREVILDDDQAAPLVDDDEFWREQQPPHYS